MNLLLKLAEYTDLSQEALIVIFLLLVIASSLLSMLFVLIKAYISFRMKQKDCDGRFNEHGIEIQNLKETQKESHALAKEANDIAKTIKPKVDDIHDWWFKTVMDDKNKNIKIGKTE